MGIPGLYGRWLVKNNNRIRAILNGMPHNVASLAFDLNGIFHEAKMKVFAGAAVDVRIKQAIESTDPLLLEAEIHNHVAAIILQLVQLAQPRDCLILSVDGVAPGAKMQQQRGRRERTAYESEPFQIFDSNAITPGTDFMIRMDNFIKRFIGMYRDYLPHKIIYSSHLVPGEGEHKIMDYYRRGEVSSGAAAQNGGVHVIHGLDADFIMLSLLAPVDRIYLSRETDKGLVSVEIDAVKRYLRERTRKESIVHDFVIMMMLMGNDFLPHFPAFADMAESIDRLIDIYSAGDYTFTQEVNGRREINWHDLKRYLAVIATRENELLEMVSKRTFKNPSRFFNVAMVDGVFRPERFRSGWYQNALGPKGSKELANSLVRIIGGYIPTQQDAEIYGGRVVEPITAISPVTVDRIEKMAVDYMRILAWVYLYYSEGTAAINQEIAYPYYHTPMLVDLAAIAETVGVTRDITGYEAFPGMKPFTALHQLVAVLPLKSKPLLPVELQPLFDNNSLIRDLLPKSFIIERDGTDQPHQGIPIVPLIDRQRILDAVAQIAFTPARVKQWIPVTEEIFERTPSEAERLNQMLFQQQRQQGYQQARERTRQEREHTRQVQDRNRGGRRDDRPRNNRPFSPTAPQGTQSFSSTAAQGIRPFSPTAPKDLVPTMTDTQRARSPQLPTRGRGTRGSPRSTRGQRPDSGVISRRPSTVTIPPAVTGTLPQLVTGLPPLTGAPANGLPQLVTGLPPLTGTTPVGGLPQLVTGLPPLTGTSPVSGLPQLVTGLPPLTGTTPVGGLPQLVTGLPPLTGTTSVGGLPQLTGTMPVQPITQPRRSSPGPRDLPLLM